MTCTNYRGHLAKVLVMWRWRRGSTKKFWTPIKECLWHRQDHAQPEEKLRQSPASTSRPGPQAEYQDTLCTTYDHYKDLKGGLCKEALAFT